MDMIRLIFVLILLVPLKLHSQLLDENFEYPSGDSIGAHGWVAFSGGSANRILINSPGLNFFSYYGSGIGNCVFLTNTGQDVYRSFSSAKDTLSLYVSFMVNVSEARSGDFFASLLSSTSSTLFTGRVYAKDSAGMLAFGLSKTTSAAGGIFYTPAVYSYNNTYLLVLKYRFNESGNTDDEVSLFVYQDFVPSNEPLPDIGPVTGTGADMTDAGRFSLRQGTTSSSPELFIDGIFVTTSWDNNALPVELISFYSNTDGRNVKLNWSTGSELNNYGFSVERSVNGEKWITAGFVNGHGTTNIRYDYEFSEFGLLPGIYKYRLKQLDYNGNFETYNLNGDIVIDNPGRFQLSQNFPNPFNPVTRINFSIPEESFVKICLYDVSGRLLKTVLNEFKAAGSYTAELSISEFTHEISSGVYFYEMSAISGKGQYKDVKKMMIVK